jgi:hypothetical protein
MCPAAETTNPVLQRSPAHHHCHFSLIVIAVPDSHVAMSINHHHHTHRYSRTRVIDPRDCPSTGIIGGRLGQPFAVKTIGEVLREAEVLPSRKQMLTP